MKTIVRVVNLGRMSFHQAYVHQCQARDNLINQLKLSPQLELEKYENKLFLVEHDPVYTIGIRRKMYDDQLIDKLKSLDADFQIADRGGLITFHGPGQLTVYPVVYLGCLFPNKSIRCYIHGLEESVIKLCQRVLPNELKVSTIEEYPGVWIDGEKKIAAIGVHGKRYITTHGTCINCNNDLSWFDHIIPCGIAGKQVTSISKELGRNFTIQEAIPLFLDSFSKTFNCRVTGD